MDIGKLDRRVTLQSRSITRDTFGQEVIAWTTVAVVWAWRAPLRATEFFAAAQVQAETTIKYRIRFTSLFAPDATWRLVDAGARFDITGVLPFGDRNEAWELLCQSGVKDGR